MVILIDSSSTHNFIQDRIAKQLNLPLHQSQSFQVLVGNGEELSCDSICHQMDLSVGSHNFCVDLFVLPLSGADIVLGVQWLKILGPVLTDFEKLTMQFMKDGTRVQLQGEPKPIPTESSFHQLKRLVSTHSVDTYYTFSFFPQNYPHLHNRHLTPNFKISYTSTNIFFPLQQTSHLLGLLIIKYP